MYRHIVQYYETDRMGITHHSNYVRWMEEARIHFLDQIGWNYAKLEEMGLVSPVVSVNCRYKRPSTFADVIDIQVSVAEFKGVKLKLDYRMTNAEGQEVCEAHSEHCFLNRNGMPVRLAKEYPEFYRSLAELAAGKED